jgi:ketosteroid isomerase-like protein
MNSEQNKQLVLDLWKAFAERKFQKVSELFDDDIEWIAPEGNATAVASNGPSYMIGKEAVMQFITSGFR